MPRYDHKRIEPKWQAYWDEHETFKTPDDVSDPAVKGKPKLYVLDMFPYPSGDGLHVGHPEGYTATDIVCRYNRMRGKNVLHPMGWDAFGLPAEQHAIKTGTHPRITTDKNIGTFRRQLKMLGFSYDWSREFSTTDPEYLRWTQWIFLQLFNTWYDADCEWTDPNGRLRLGKGRPIDELPIPEYVSADGDESIRRFQDKHRLAYQHEAPVNWCAKLGTVLSNEEVIDGKSERGGHPVTRLPLRQWMLRITAYADRLLSDLEEVNWPNSIKKSQSDWIGRSEGAEVDFYIGPASGGTASGGREPAGNADQPNDVDREAGFEQWKAVREGAGFPVEPGDDVLRVYTTRPDTLFGATYMVIAPEHSFVDRLTTAEQKQAVEEYCRAASFKSDLDRTELAKEKTGVFTGSHAVNPANGEPIPIWVADYVLISYGTGAIMAVPAHDDRDHEFATTFSLPVRCVVSPSTMRQDGIHENTQNEWRSWRNSVLAGITVFTDQLGDAERKEVQFEGRRFWTIGPTLAVNSGEFDGLATAAFKEKISATLADSGLGKQAVNYRLRDWLFSRQHFWGEPFPVWHELDADGNMTGLMRTDAESELPVSLPENFDFQPHGRPEPPLDEAPDDWLYKTIEVEDGNGGQSRKRLKRETNSMPQWAGSCWYYLRFCDPRNEEQFVDPAKEKYWMPVDLYIGGAEHAVLHLLYARFWHKVLFDHGHVSTSEPFNRLVNQGMILGEPRYFISVEVDDEFKVIEPHRYISFPDEDQFNVMSDISLEELGVEPKFVDGKPFVTIEGTRYECFGRAEKMSKSRGNVINPDDVVDQYGADALRMYEMFMGPLEQMKPWNMSGVEGVSRFIGRVWRMTIDDRADHVRLSDAIQDADPTDDQLRVLHKTIKAVTEDIEKLSFNTAISRMMEFTNALTQCDVRPRSVIEPFVLLLAPFAPHLAEELWATLGHDDTLAYESWPEFDEARIAEDTIEIPVQVNGKVRGKVSVPTGADRDSLQTAAEADEIVQKHLDGKQVVKVIVVPGRLVNFVVK